MLVAVAVLALRGTDVGVLPWVFVASGLVCFALEPQALAPAEQGRELDWSMFWHVAGNSYLWWAIAATVMLRFLSRRLPAVDGGLEFHP